MFKFVLALIAFVVQVESHGHLWSPMQRSTLWMGPNFPEQPVNWNNGELWCGKNPQDVNFSTCGRCGDAPGGTDNIQGGKYGNNFIAANYTSGSIIPIVAQFHYAHLGYFELELCPQETETDDCFQPLEIVGGSAEIINNRICVPYDGPMKYVTAALKLPEGVRCTRCTLRWNYRTSTDYGSNYPACFNPNPIQAFRNCADIAIL